MPDYLNDLNEAQKKAVTNYEGPSLVIAGAGSGKTRVLTYRIAYLLHSGVRPGSILALTFTNKAADEMKERITELVGGDVSKHLWMGTFHSIFAKILRMEADKLGYTPNYTIYDTADSKSLLKSIIKEMKLDDQVYKVNEILNRISSAKNNLVTSQTYSGISEYTEYDRMLGKPETANIYKRYSARCSRSDVMDFDDLLLNTNILFRDNAEALAKYQERFRYILIDEYQDTNFSQYIIIKKLSELHRNICVVGDDAQSIYSFRGARIENILNFKNDFTDYNLYKLEQNYRSTKTIVNAANSLIYKNKKQISKKIWSDNEKGSRVKVVKALTDNEEGNIVAGMIFDNKLTAHYNYSDYAILYRTNAQSRIFEESLRKLNIPYRIYGGISFYHRKEIKDMLAYFRLTINHYDEEAFRRIVNYPARGIGSVTVSRLENFSYTADTRIWDIIASPDEYEPGINKGIKTKLKLFHEHIESFSVKLNELDAYDLAHHIASSTGILKELYNDKSPESISKFENVQELLNGIKEFTLNIAPDENGIVTLNRYLENVSLLTNEDYDTKEDRDKVALMTVHSAKGLEFNNVFIVGAEEDLFPSHMSLSTNEELEEERRLFYVALTRAMKNATISYAVSRYKWGSLINCRPSRFVNEMDNQYIDNPSDNHNNTYNKKNSDNDFNISRKEYFSTEYQRSKKPGIKKLATTNNNKGEKLSSVKGSEYDDQENIQVGMQVEHQRFGTGKVINLEGFAPDIKATVFFKSSGQKQLLLKFAKLRIVK